MMASIRKWLLAGLLVIVPVIITLWVLDWMIGTLDKTLLILPQSWHPDKLLGIHIPGFGVLLAFAILLFLGALTSNFLGNKLLNWWNALLNRIPVVRSIYSGVKQVSDTLFSDTGNAFRKAVLIQCRVTACGPLLLSPAFRAATRRSICRATIGAFMCPPRPTLLAGIL